MADFGKCENPFFGGVFVVIDTGEHGTSGFDLPFMGGVFLCVEQAEGGGGGSGEGGLFFCHG